MKTAICNKDIHPARYVILAGLLHWLNHGDSVPFTPTLSEFDPFSSHSFMMHSNRKPASDGATLLKDSLASSGERWRTSTSTTQKDWILRQAKLANDLSSLRLTSLRDRFGSPGTQHFMAKLTMKLGSIETLKSRRFDITTTSHIYCLSMINITVLAPWKNFSGSASNRRCWLRIVKQSVEDYQHDRSRQSLLTSFFARHSP